MTQSSILPDVAAPRKLPRRDRRDARFTPAAIPIGSGGTMRLLGVGGDGEEGKGRKTMKMGKDRLADHNLTQPTNTATV